MLTLSCSSRPRRLPRHHDPRPRRPSRPRRRSVPDADPVADRPGPPAWPALGEPCGANDTCGAGAECVTYYGIAGPKGPAFKSCEIRCTPDAACPDGRKCTTVADGPGSVCR